MDENRITNDLLYNAVAAGIDRVRDRVIEELLMSDDEKGIDEVLDGIQTAMVTAEKANEIYRSWIFEGTIPEKYIYNPGGEDIIDEEEEDE